jgi:hypothetical protein
MSSDPIELGIRVWTNPGSEKDKPSLVYLKPDALCLAVVPAADLEKTAAALLGGGAVVAQIIPLRTITQLEGDEGDNLLNVAFKQGEGKSDSVDISLVDGSQRDEVLDALRVCLGSDWECERRREGRLSASGLPLFVTAVAAVLTWEMYDEAQRITAGEHLKVVGGNARTKIFSFVMHWVEGHVGVTGVLILGGLLVTLGLWWLVYAVTHPSIRITVRPRGTSGSNA